MVAFQKHLQRQKRCVESCLFRAQILSKTLSLPPYPLCSIVPWTLQSLLKKQSWGAIRWEALTSAELFLRQSKDRKISRKKDQDYKGKIVNKFTHISTNIFFLLWKKRLYRDNILWVPLTLWLKVHGDTIISCLLRYHGKHSLSSAWGFERKISQNSTSLKCSSDNWRGKYLIRNVYVGIIRPSEN